MSAASAHASILSLPDLVNGDADLVRRGRYLTATFLVEVLSNPRPSHFRPGQCRLGDARLGHTGLGNSRPDSVRPGGSRPRATPLSHSPVGHSVHLELIIRQRFLDRLRHGVGRVQAQIPHPDHHGQNEDQQDDQQNSGPHAA